MCVRKANTVPIRASFPQRGVTTIARYRPGQSSILVIWHKEDNRIRLSTVTDWRYTLSWVQTHRHLLTLRAYTSFIMTQVSSDAAQEKAWKAFWFLLWEACRNGKPSIIDILAHTVIWLIPKKVRTRLVRLFDRIRGSRVLKSS
jgi:hypothetical protein